MVVIPLIFEIKESPPIEARRAAHGEAMRAAHLEQGRAWTRGMLPNHFTEGARRKYRYKPRPGRTVIRKIRAARAGKAILGGRVDLVWTGQLMRAVLGHQSVLGNSKSVTIRMFGPSYLYPFDKRKNQPDKAHEITTVAGDEYAELEGVLDRNYHARINAVKETTITRIGG